MRRKPLRRGRPDLDVQRLLAGDGLNDHRKLLPDAQDFVLLPKARVQPKKLDRPRGGKRRVRDRHQRDGRAGRGGDHLRLHDVLTDRGPLHKKTVEGCAALVAAAQPAACGRPEKGLLFARPRVSTRRTACAPTTATTSLGSRAKIESVERDGGDRRHGFGGRLHRRLPT